MCLFPKEVPSGCHVSNTIQRCCEQWTRSIRFGCSFYFAICVGEPSQMERVICCKRTVPSRISCTEISTRFVSILSSKKNVRKHLFSTNKKLIQNKDFYWATYHILINGYIPTVQYLTNLQSRNSVIEKKVHVVLRKVHSEKSYKYKALEQNVFSLHPTTFTLWLFL